MRLFLTMLALATALLSRPPAEAASPTVGPVSIVFTGLVVDGETIGRLGLSVDAETGETAYSGKVPDLEAPTNASWKSVEISFDVADAADRFRFFWKLDAAEITDISYLQDGANDIIGMLENLRIGEASVPGGEFSFLPVDGADPSLKGRHGRISLTDMTGEKLGAASVSAIALSLSGTSSAGNGRADLDIAGASIAGLDIAYLASIGEQSEIAGSEFDDPAQLADVLEKVALQQAGYDSLAIDDLRSKALVDRESFEFAIDHIGSAGVRGLRQGPSIVRGVSVRMDGGVSMGFAEAYWSGIDLTESAFAIAELLRTRPELFEPSDNNDLMLLGEFPAFDFGKGGVRSLSVNPGKADPLTVSAIRIDRMAMGEDGKFRFDLAIEGTDLPKSLMEGGDLDVLVRMLDHVEAPSLAGDFSLALVTDVENRNVVLENVRLSADSLARVELNADLMTPERASRDWGVTASLNFLRFRIEDDRLFDALFAVRDDTGAPLMPSPEEIIQQLRGMQAMMNTDPGRAVYDDLVAFVDGAPNLEMKLAPQQPVALEQLGGILLLGADAAIQFLGLELRVWD